MWIVFNLIFMTGLAGHTSWMQSFVITLKYFPNHYTPFRLKGQGQCHREHDSINNAWLSTGLDMTCGEEPEGDFVSKDPQCSKRITVSGGFNIYNTNPRVVHISWSSHPKELSLCVNRNKQVHLHIALDLAWKWSLATVISLHGFHVGAKKRQRRISKKQNYIMFNSSPMGLAAGKTDISMHLINYMKWDPAAIIVTSRLIGLPRLDHEII